MNILIIDSTSDRLYVVAKKDGGVFCANLDACRAQHSAVINVKIERALALAGMTVGDVDVFAVNTGPGSFTGIRVGIASVYGLNAPLSKPLIEINSFEVLSFLCQRESEILIPATKGQFFCARYCLGERLSEMRLGEADASSGYVEGQDSDRTDALVRAAEFKIGRGLFTDVLCPLYIQKPQAERDD